MKLVTFLPFALCILLLVSGGQEKVDPHSAALEQFTKRITEYAMLHKRIKSEMHGLKPTDSPEQVENEQRQFANRIREARHEARQGDIFEPAVAAEFRRLVGITMQGSAGQLIRGTLKDTEPVRPIRLRVNELYPDGAPVKSTPPSLLLNLPKLPPEIEYRVVGRDLVLRDRDANLTVDFLPHAIS